MKVYISNGSISIKNSIFQTSLQYENCKHVSWRLDYIVEFLFFSLVYSIIFHLKEWKTTTVRRLGTLEPVTVGGEVAMKKYTTVSHIHTEKDHQVLLLKNTVILVIEVT